MEPYPIPVINSYLDIKLEKEHVNIKGCINPMLENSDRYEFKWIFLSWRYRVDSNI